MPVGYPTYPPAFPTVSGENITVSAFLANPARVFRVIQDLTLQRYVAERIFTAGPRATGGAVVYDQVVAGDFFTDRDVEIIQPGAEFPILTASAPNPKVAAVDKWGGRVRITDEARDRNQIDVLNRELTRLRNTIVRKVDTVALAALDAAPINPSVGLDFTTATVAQIVAVFVAAAGLINNPDMGYEATAVFMNPVQADEMMGNIDLIKLLQPEGPSQPLRTGNLGRMLSMDFYKTNRVAAGFAYVVATGQIGGISDEVPLRTAVYREEGVEATYVQAGRRLVPYVTDPKAVTKISAL